MLFPVSKNKELFGFDLPAFFKTDANLMKSDVKEYEDHFEILTDLPGWKKDEVEISLDNGCLVISVSRDEEKKEADDKGKTIVSERSFKSASRSFFVGHHVNAEDVKAKFDGGVLNVRVEKREKDPDDKRITIE